MTYKSNNCTCQSSELYSIWNAINEPVAIINIIINKQNTVCEYLYGVLSNVKYNVDARTNCINPNPNDQNKIDDNYEFIFLFTLTSFNPIKLIKQHKQHIK